MTKIFSNLLFNDLASELEYVRSMDGLAAGTFTDMYGFEVTFAPEELPTYIENTMRVIRSTKDSSGKVVGLPIDAGNHDHEGGAGWITALELDSARNVIKFIVNWTEVGIDLISKNIRRFFSPTVDVENKIIIGGSLTNYPATRDQKGRILLQPVELSDSLKGLNMDKTLVDYLKELPANIAAALRPAKADPGTGKDDGEAEDEGGEGEGKKPLTLAEALLSNTHNPSLASLGQDAGKVAELDDAVKQIVTQRVNAELRTQHTTRFVAELIGGTKAKPYGFNVKSKELIAWMLSLTDAQAKFAERLLTSMADRAIDFAERGWEQGSGFSQLPTLPDVFKPMLRQFMATKGNTIEAFFKLNPEVGKVEDFNLTEFQMVKE